MLIAVGVVAGLAGVLVIFSQSFVFSGSSRAADVNSNSISYQKARILALVETKNFLTPNEKDAIGRAIIGERVKMYNFTNEEINKVINALNKN